MASESVSFSPSFAPGVPSFVRRNDRDRVRRRLMRIGMSTAQVEQILGGAVPFAPIPGAETTRSGTDLALERILGKNDLVNVRFLEAGRGPPARSAESASVPRAAAISGMVPGLWSPHACS